MNGQQITETAEAAAMHLMGAECSQPFGPGVDVYKAFEKIFLLCSQHQGQQIVTLKCAPENSIMLRDIYPSIKPGYHMNKKHWISIYPGDEIHADLVKNLVEDSYDLILKTIPKKKKISSG